MIREATPDDTYAVLAMGHRFYETTYYPSFAPYDRDSVRALAENLMDAGVLLVAEREGRLVGMVGLALFPFIFNRAETLASEVMWWVDPEWRDQGLGLELLGAVAPACHAAGAQAIQMLRLESSPPQADQLYQRLGYVLREHSYLKVL